MDKSPEWHQIRKLDFKDQLWSGFVALTICSPLIPFLPVSSGVTVWDATGLLGLVVVYGIGLAIIAVTSLKFASQTASKSLKNT